MKKIVTCIIASALALLAASCGTENCPPGAHQDSLFCKGTTYCATASDCASGVCLDGECADPTCADGVQNGTETGVDCGGSCADAQNLRCQGGSSCARNEDCASGICTDGVCTASTCSDGTLNGTETDIDCGGQECTGCSLNQTCEEDTDCQSGVCNEGVCGPSDGRYALLMCTATGDTSLNDTTAELLVGPMQPVGTAVGSGYTIELGPMKAR